MYIPVRQSVADNQAVQVRDLRHSCLPPTRKASVGGERQHLPRPGPLEQSNRVVKSAPGVHHVVHDDAQRPGTGQSSGGVTWYEKTDMFEDERQIQGQAGPSLPFLPC